MADKVLCAFSSVWGQRGAEDQQLVNGKQPKGRYCEESCGWARGDHQIQEDNDMDGCTLCATNPVILSRSAQSQDIEQSEVVCQGAELGMLDMIQSGHEFCLSSASLSSFEEQQQGFGLRFTQRLHGHRLVLVQGQAIAVNGGLREILTTIRGWVIPEARKGNQTGWEILWTSHANKKAFGTQHAPLTRTHMYMHTYAHTFIRKFPLHK